MVCIRLGIYNFRRFKLNGKPICIALPIQVNGLGKISRMTEDLAEYINGLGYKTIESHMVYIHSSLTREIMVYEKT